jgi:hypothetical protein
LKLIAFQLNQKKRGGERKMKWLFVEKGTKRKQLVFVACKDNGEPVNVFKDINLAWHHELSENVVGHKISDYNRESKKIIEAMMNGKTVEDKRPITKLPEFKRIQKEHKTELKI